MCICCSLGTVHWLNLAHPHILTGLAFPPTSCSVIPSRPLIRCHCFLSPSFLPQTLRTCVHVINPILLPIVFRFLPPHPQITPRLPPLPLRHPLDDTLRYDSTRSSKLPIALVSINQSLAYLPNFALWSDPVFGKSIQRSHPISVRTIYPKQRH